MGTYDKLKIKTLLSTNDKAVIRGLLAIYSRQTAAEQAADSTLDHNGVGFSSADGEILGSFAKWFQAKGFLTPKQLAISRNKLAKYHRQLLDIAKANGHTVSYK